MTEAIRPMPEEMPVELWRGVKPSSPAWQGRVVSLFVAPKSAEEMVSLSNVRAMADRGLEGDRFFRDSWNAIKRSDKAVSLIEDEVLELAAAELGVESVPDPFRLRQYLLKARRERAGNGDAAIRRRINHLEVGTFPASPLFGNLDA